MIDKTISNYHIVEKLGEGGMGVVYKAKDTKLDRMVALKFLPSNLAASEQDKARLVQEAKAAAALNHPNVCSIIDIQEHGGQMFIVMEFVDGQTLREKQASISFKQAVDIGIQIADGLASAHEKGIVHRDIKPENIMVRKDGICQIMDFGLAKLRNASSKINRLTKEGSTVGTAGYMSPEQVQGQDVGHRSDIFSLGALLYEMFTGQLPFKGVHETALMYEIVNVDPAPMNAIKPEIDPALDLIILDCLEKDPNERCQSVAEVARDLRRMKRESTRQRHSRITAARPQFSTANVTPPPTTPQHTTGAVPTSKKTPWLFTLMFFLLAIGVLIVHFVDRPTEKHEIIRFTISSPERGSFGRQAPAVSPDGKAVAFIANDSSGKSSVWVHTLATLIARPLPGTDDASFPFWSFDSRFIAFFSDGKLKKIDLNGSPPQTICDAPEGRGGSWSSIGIIIFAPNYATGIQQVPSAGGVPSYVTFLDSTLKEDSHRWPYFMPDGHNFLYLRRGTSDKSGIYIGSVDSKETKLVLPSKANAIYTSSGHLLYLREATLMAQPFDLGKNELREEPVPIAEEVGSDLGYSYGFFSASQNGVLAVGAGTGISYRQLVWFDRSGKKLQAVGQSGTLFDFALSPDEKRVVFRRVDQQAGNHDLWIFDLVRATESRFTFSAALDDDPVWAPDGNSIIFDSNPEGVSNIFQKVATGAGKQELLLKSSLGNYPYDYSSDGHYIMYSQDAVGSNNAAIWILPLIGDKKQFAFTQGDANATDAKFSPDVKWIVYSSNESGKPDIYVQAFPATQGKWQVSTNGGSASEWSKNGKEIFYIAPNKKLMVVDVKTAGSSFEQGLPKVLFEIDVDRYTAPNRYAVSKDGQRILVNLPAEGASELPLTVVLNWTEELSKK